MHQTPLNNYRAPSPNHDYELYNLALEAGIVDAAGFFTAEERAAQAAWWKRFKRCADQGRRLYAAGRDMEVLQA